MTVPSVKLVESPRAAYKNVERNDGTGGADWIGGTAGNRAACMQGQTGVYSELGVGKLEP